MKALTIRDVPKEIEKKVKQLAVQKNISLNKAVISLLEETAETKKRKRTLYHDLDHLAGSWNNREASLFEKTLKQQRSIDKEIWK